MALDKVPLDKPIAGHGGVAFSEVTIRAPKPIEYLTIGEPVQYARTKEKVTIMAEDDARIAAHVQNCIVSPVADVVLAQCTLADAMRIKDAVLDFFSEARTSLLSQKPTSSSLSSA